jgi:hypothetical protein
MLNISALLPAGRLNLFTTRFGEKRRRLKVLGSLTDIVPLRMAHPRERHEGPRLFRLIWPILQFVLEQDRHFNVMS